MSPIGVPRFRLLLAVSLLLLGEARGRAAAKVVAADPAVQGFWSSFRSAVAKKDTDALLGLANFPFVIRWGNADENDPRVQLSRRELATAIDRVLAIHTADSDPHSAPMATVVAKTAAIPPADAASGEFVLESFEFRKVKGAWRWTAAYSTDPSFYPSAESSDVPRVSPLRKILLDATAQAMDLRRPLTVKHLKTTGRAAYLEAKEAGKTGRTARAFLERQPDDAAGKTRWLVKDSSFLPATGGDVDWREKLAALKKSGIPASVFPPETARQEGDGHASPP